MLFKRFKLRMQIILTFYLFICWTERRYYQVINALKYNYSDIFFFQDFHAQQHILASKSQQQVKRMNIYLSPLPVLLLVLV